MSWKHRDLDEKLQAAIDVLGSQPWETAYKDSENLEYRVLRLNDYSREEAEEIRSALDALTITYMQKPMAPFKSAKKGQYTPVLKVFSWSSIESVVKMAKNPDTTVLEVTEAIKRAAALTAFEKVFPDVDDFLAFQTMLHSEEIRDHVKGGVVLKVNLNNTSVEGLQDVLQRSGLDINQIEFSYEGGPEDVFIPNEAFPDNVRPVTVYEGD